MTITINIPPDMEARLIAQADALQMSVEQYLQSLIQSNLAEQNSAIPSTHEERMAALERFCNNPALANVPPLSDEAISRESIYREREDSQL
jgi:hypothetical protein